jgi:hypothetical protein
MHRCPSLAALVLMYVCAAGPVQAAQDLWVNPGTMGPNALPTQPGDTARIPESLVLHLSTAGQLTRAGDRSFTPWFRVEAPFGRWASMISEGRPVELWRVSSATREAWNLTRDSGSTGGDLSFGVKFRAFDGGRRWPTLTVRNMTKSTTGKGFWERRHTNAPAYLLDLLATQPLTRLGTARLELWAALGFYAWQQGRNGQNDAPAWSATLAANWDAGSLVRLDVRGYEGWQTDDRPKVVAATAEWALAERFSLFATANVGLVDAPLLDAHLGVVVRLPALLPLSIEEDESPAR